MFTHNEIQCFTRMLPILTVLILCIKGAFRLPEGREHPKTFDYVANAMTINPKGDVSNSNDGFPGSLFITGHDRLVYGELPNGSQIAEVSIPVPIFSGLPSNLPFADFLQRFVNVTQGLFVNQDEIYTPGKGSDERTYYRIILLI